MSIKYPPQPPKHLSSVKNFTKCNGTLKILKTTDKSTKAEHKRLTSGKFLSKDLRAVAFGISQLDLRDAGLWGVTAVCVWGGGEDGQAVWGRVGNAR